LSSRHFYVFVTGFFLNKENRIRLVIDLLRPGQREASKVCHSNIIIQASVGKRLLFNQVIIIAVSSKELILEYIILRI